MQAIDLNSGDTQIARILDDDALIAQFLGPKYIGRRYLRYAELEALGLCDNRASLKLWMDAGAFPRGIKIPGPYGKTLVWFAVEVVRLIAQRMRERDESPTANETGAPVLRQLGLGEEGKAVVG
jgi:hypothetical protein